MNSITTKSFIVRVFGLAAILVLVMIVVSPVGAATSGTLHIDTDTTLTEDHYGSIVIAEDGVTLDCANHTITGYGGDWGILLFGREDVTIRDCRITNFVHGILLEYSPSNQLIGNTVFGNREDGIRLNYTSDSNTLNTNVSKNNGRHGFAFSFVSGNIIENNEAVGNGAVGFASGEANNNMFTANEATHNPTGFFIENTVGSYLEGNTANKNEVGIWLQYSNINHLTGNASNNNVEHGIVLWYSQDNFLVTNTANNNDVDGFAIAFADDNTLSMNKANNNGHRGFSLWDSSGNTLAENTAMHNYSIGFLADGSSQSNDLMLNRGCNNIYLDALDVSTGTGNTWFENNFCIFSGF